MRMEPSVKMASQTWNAESLQVATIT